MERLVLKKTPKRRGAKFLNMADHLYKEAVEVFSMPMGEVSLPTACGLLHSCALKTGNAILVWKTGLRCVTGPCDAFVCAVEYVIRRGGLPSQLDSLMRINQMALKSCRDYEGVKKDDVEKMFREVKRWKAWVGRIIKSRVGNSPR